MCYTDLTDGGTHHDLRGTLSFSRGEAVQHGVDQPSPYEAVQEG